MIKILIKLGIKFNIKLVLEIVVGVYIIMDIFWVIMLGMLRIRFKFRVGIGMGRLLIRRKFSNILILDFNQFQCFIILLCELLKLDFLN
jgi:hypothetical protein